MSKENSPEDLSATVADIEVMKAHWRVTSNAHLKDALRMVAEYPPAMREVIIEEGRRRFGADVPIGLAMPPEPPGVYGGISRSGYIVGIIVISFLNATIAQINFLAAYVITSVLFFVLSVYRLRNLGKSGTLAFILFIPIASFFVAVPCLAFPEGYEQHRKLDLSAKVIIGVLIGITILVIVAAVIDSAV